MTRQLTHSGTAGTLLLSNALTVPPTGPFQLTVDGNAAGQGWPSIPTGSAIVVTVGRGTAVETKYLVSSITSGVTTSTLTVPDWGRGYDGTSPVNLPSHATVEHTISAAEMADLNTHLLSKSAHGASGELIDQNSAQSMTNKTFPTPPPADNSPATKKYADDLSPIGSIIMFAGTTGYDTSRWQLCDGSAISRTVYAGLFAALGTLHGTGDNATTFNVPDLRGRFVVGAGAGTSLTNRVLGSKGGLEKVTLTIPEMPSHAHTAIAGNDTPDHSHFVNGATAWAGEHGHTVQTYTAGRGSGSWMTDMMATSGGPGLGTANPNGNHQHGVQIQSDGASARHSHDISVWGTGGDGSHENMPPFFALTYLIRKA